MHIPPSMPVPDCRLSCRLWGLRPLLVTMRKRKGKSETCNFFEKNSLFFHPYIGIPVQHQARSGIRNFRLSYCMQMGNSFSRLSGMGILTSSLSARRTASAPCQEHAIRTSIAGGLMRLIRLRTAYKKHV